MTAAKPKTRRSKKPASKKPAAKKPAAKRRSRIKTASGKAGRLALSATTASARLGGWTALRGLKLAETTIVWSLKNQDVRRVGALGFLAVCLAVVSQQIKTRVESMPRYQVRSSLALSGPPPGLSEAANRDLAGLKLPARANAFDPTLVPTVADRLGALPWVSKVTEVRIAPPNRIEFALETRRPLARLGEGPRAPLVTRDGAVIARRYGEDAEGLPRFLGIPGEATARAQALTAGAGVLDALGPLRTQVTFVDLTNLGGHRAPLESEVVLTLRSGLKVDWGRAGITDRPQRPAPGKRAALERFLTSGVAHRAARVSLRWERVTWTEKATPESVARVD